ncbi:MAG: TlpA disulfide reductase family protein [Microthrixaceae bacterium]
MSGITPDPDPTELPDEPGPPPAAGQPTAGPDDATAGAPGSLRRRLPVRDLVIGTVLALVASVVVAVAVVSLTGNDQEDDGVVSIDEFLDREDPGAAPGSPEVGQPLPDLDLTLFDGSTTTLDAFVDRPTVLNVWASTCPPCLREMPAFQAVHEDVGKEVAFLGLDSGESIDDGEPFAKDRGVTYALAEDPDLERSTTLGLVGLPMTLFIDADGVLAGRKLGAMDESELRAKITEYLGVEA